MKFIKSEKNAILKGGKLVRRGSALKSSQNQLSSQVMKRRNETFAEAEQRLKVKNIEIGIIGPGEISGLCEVLFELPTYMQNVKCVEDCDVFYIHKRSYERLILKRNPTCAAKMRDYTYMKLVARNNRLKRSSPIELYRSLQYSIEVARKKRLSLASLPTSGKRRNPLQMPPKGPIIQLNLRSKLSAYKRVHRQSNNAFHVDELTESSTNKAFSQTRLSLNEQSDKAGNEKVDSVDSAFGSIENETEDAQNWSMSEIMKINESENSNEEALVNLENRIKRWHLNSNVGSSKACVPKLNRIDLDVKIFII